MQDRLQSLLELLGQSPEEAFLLYAVAHEYSKRGNIQTAIEYFNRLRRTHPQYVGLYYHLGKLQQQLGNFDLARQVFIDGREIAKSIGDMHALSELQRAMDELEQDD